MTAPPAPGFFGKVPSHGDFVARRLPAAFVSVWDGWLQAGLADSRGRLGADWLAAYLHSPIWRFALDAGVCGPQAWAGLMMPSVDRVGRYFPLTIGLPLDDKGLVPDEVWYAGVETLALSGLDPGFSLAAFDAALQALAAPNVHGVPLVPLVAPAEAAGAGRACFWRDGQAALTSRGLPAAERFAGMLDGAVRF